MLKIVTGDADRDDLGAPCWTSWWPRAPAGCWWLALEAEVADYVDRHVEQWLMIGWHRLVVRNGKAPERTLVTGAGALRVRAPRVR